MGVREGNGYPDIDQLAYDIKQEFISAMDDDLNFPRALSEFFNIIKKINILVKDRQINPDNAQLLLNAFKSVDEVIRIFDFKPREVDPALLDMMKEREAARNAGDFGESGPDPGRTAGTWIGCSGPKNIVRALKTYCAWSYGVKIRLKMLTYRYKLRFCAKFCLV